MKKKILITVIILIAILLIGSVKINADLSGDYEGEVTGEELFSSSSPRNYSGAWETAEMEYYCVDHGDKITAKMRSTYVTRYDNINPNDYGQVRNRTVYKASDKINLETDTYYAGKLKEQTYQGIAYILSSTTSGANKQEALWRTTLNKYNTGNYEDEVGKRKTANYDYACDADDEFNLNNITFEEENDAQMEDLYMDEDEEKGGTKSVHTKEGISTLFNVLNNLEELGVTSEEERIQTQYTYKVSRLVDNIRSKYYYALDSDKKDGDVGYEGYFMRKFSSRLFPVEKLVERGDYEGYENWAKEWPIINETNGTLYRLYIERIAEIYYEQQGISDRRDCRGRRSEV